MIENQNRDLSTVNTCVGSNRRREVPIADLPVPDAWHAAMRSRDKGDQRMLLNVWHLAHDFRDKLLRLAMEGPKCGHSACSQHYIDTGATHCVEGDGS